MVRQNEAETESLSDYFESRRDCKVVECTDFRVELTDIPFSATHMLPGGMGTLSRLADAWGEGNWSIDYVDNDGTVMYGSRSDKNVVITRK